MSCTQDHGLNWLDYGNRWYNASIGRMISIDPLASKFPNESTYVYAGNNPIKNIDVQGSFKLSSEFISKYPAFANYLQGNISEILKSDAIVNSLVKNGGFDRATIESDIKFGNGPTIDIRGLSSENLTVFGHYDGLQANGEFQIALDEDMISRFEKAFANEGLSNDLKEASLLGIVSTLLHEYTHHGTGGSDFETEEMGHKFEIDAYGTGLEPDDINQLMQVRTLKTTGKLVDPFNHRKVIEMKPDKKPEIELHK